MIHWLVHLFISRHFFVFSFILLDVEDDYLSEEEDIQTELLNKKSAEIAENQITAHAPLDLSDTESPIPPVI